MCLWDVRTKIGAILLLAGLPTLFRHGALRAATAVLCYGIALVLVHRVLNAPKVRLDELQMSNEELVRDIGGMITSMQFQDITRQRIEHVIDR